MRKLTRAVARRTQSDEHTLFYSGLALFASLAVVSLVGLLLG